MPVVAADHPRPPPGRVPGIVPVREYVATGEQAAVMLLELRGYSQGCLVELVAVTRTGGPGPDGVGEAPRTSVELAGELLTAERPTSADGCRAMHRLDPPPVPARAGVRHTVLLWLTPLPPVEGATLVLDWPEHGLRDARLRLDGEAIRRAAFDSFPLLPA